jgi:hypothetical protein
MRQEQLKAHIIQRERVPRDPHTKARLLVQPQALFPLDELPARCDRVIDPVCKIEEVRADGEEGGDDAGSTVGKLHEVFWSRRKGGGPVARVGLVLEQRVQVVLDAGRVLWIREHDLRDDTDDTVGGPCVDGALVGPGPWARKDRVDDCVGGGGQEDQSCPVVGEGGSDQTEEVQIASAASEPVVVCVRVHQGGEVRAEVLGDAGVLEVGSVEGEVGYAVFYYAASARADVGELIYVVAHVGHVGEEPRFQWQLVNHKVWIVPFEGEEEESDRHWAIVESATRWDCVGREISDESLQGCNEVVIGGLM